jgi:LysM repeat protein
VPEIHVVRPRETINSIAKRYGVKAGDVLRLNSLSGHDAIRPGDRLRIADRVGSAR